MRKRAEPGAGAHGRVVPYIEEILDARTHRTLGQEAGEHVRRLVADRGVERILPVFADGATGTRGRALRL
jgi:hypothetical protein